MFSNQALKKLIIPLFLDQILLTTVSITATMLLSYAGEAAFSGVSLVDMINILMIQILAALAVGGAVVVSQYIGLKDRDKALTAASQLITVTAAIASMVTVVVLVFYMPILRLLFGNVDPIVMKSAAMYFIVSSLSYPFLALYNSGAALFRAMGNSRVPMVVSVLTNVLNIAGNALAIFVFHTGVMGVAITTLLARVLAAVLVLALSFNAENMIHIKLSRMLTYDKAMVSRILKIAVPNGIENGTTQLGRVLLVSITALFGTTQIAANGVANSLSGIGLCFAAAMNLAIVPVVGQCVGANDYEQAKRYIVKLMKLTTIITAVICLGQLLFMPLMLNMFSLSKESWRLSFILVAISNLFEIFLWPASFTLPNALRAAGDAKYTMTVSIGAMFVIRILAAYVLGVIFRMGVIGVYLAMVIDWVFRSTAYVLRYRNGKWMNFRVI
jgi:putative MATE family efflux protein